MGGLLSGIGNLLGIGSTSSPNAAGKNNLGVAEQARDDAASRYKKSSTDIIDQFMAATQNMKNPALSGQYAPTAQDPNALSRVTAPQIGSVYSGFHPGQVQPSTPGGSGSTPTYASVLAGVQAQPNGSPIVGGNGTVATPGDGTVPNAGGRPGNFNGIHPLPRAFGGSRNDLMQEKS